MDPVSERYGAVLGPKIDTARASHVESLLDLSHEAHEWLEKHRRWLMIFIAPVDPNLFWADMLPVGGPVLGPYVEYAQAIAAEIRWLQQHNLPEQRYVER